MDVGELLLRLAVALLAARVAAEIAERLRQPAVLFEIAAGVLLGPSLIGLVQGDEVIRALGELGAVLLLFEVGLHMDLRELGRVGRSALQVAAIGVVMPMVLAYPILRALDVSPRISIFLAAGITATSVGITARVFSDLRALASSEARTVLGAAVADDVAGLVILAIVVGAASESGVAATELAGTIGFALLFLVVATVLGVWLVPRVIGRLSRASRTDGTSMILALVVALALAGAASNVKLAPVVGAFVAGLAVGPSARREEIQRRLQPIGQVLIPLFFLHIGIDTQLRAFGQARVLLIAAALTAVAVIGKIAAGLGVRRGTADRLLVGIAMIPRGEVGLIFASIGLSQHFLDPRSHSILVVTVMVSTVVSPALIRARIRHIRRAEARGAVAEEPAGGWLRLTADEAEISAEPPVSLAPSIGLDAAVACASRRPGPHLLAWLSELPPSDDLVFDDDLRAKLFRLLAQGTRRSWRFLEVTGLLARLLPEVEAVVGRRVRDPFDLDPGGALRFETLEGLQRLESDPRDPASTLWAGVEDPNVVRLAALSRDALDPEEIDAQAARLAATLGLDDASAALLSILVADRSLLPAASRRIDMGTEDMVLELATHLGSPAVADALYVLAAAEDAMEPTERERLDELHQLVKKVLEHPEVLQISGGDIIEQRRREALRALAGSLPEREIRDHLDDAPARYLLAQTPDAIARHIRMIETRPLRFETRLEAEPNGEPGVWKVHLAFRDRHGALAAVAWAFSQCRVAVQEASISTWRSEVAIDVFRVTAPSNVDWDAVRAAISAELEHPHSNGVPPVVEGSVEIDNEGSPWHSIVEVRARDRAGLLYRVASALARAGTDIHTAQLTTVDGVAVDTFGVTGRNGAKLDDAGQKAVRLAFAGKAPLSWRTPLRRFKKTVRS